MGNSVKGLTKVQVDNIQQPFPRFSIGNILNCFFPKSVLPMTVIGKISPCVYFEPKAFLFFSTHPVEEGQ